MRVSHGCSGLSQRFLPTCPGYAGTTTLILLAIWLPTTVSRPCKPRCLPLGLSVSDQTRDIVIVEDAIDPIALKTLVERFFEDMVKYVVDVERGIAAVGGELHADAEALLLEAGSRQDDLWGANYYPGTGPGDCIEFTSLINIRPAQGNRSMEVEDLALRERMREVTFQLIGRGEPLS